MSVFQYQILFLFIQRDDHEVNNNILNIQIVTFSNSGETSTHIYSFVSLENIVGEDKVL